MKRLIAIAFGLSVIALGLTIAVFCLTLMTTSSTGSASRAEAGIEKEVVTRLAVDTSTNVEHSILVVDDELPLVIQNCTGCHSAKLIAQNKATREGWKNMIVWMQETQNLWHLGPNEEKILDYLARHYSPERVGRRKNLENIVWYDLN